MPGVARSALGTPSPRSPDEHRHQHQPGAVRRRHQERPQHQLPRSARACRPSGDGGSGWRPCRPRSRGAPPRPASGAGAAGSTSPSRPTATATSPMARAWPRAIGPSAATTARSRRSWRPRATAKSQPIAGFSPWKAPSSASEIQGQDDAQLRHRPTSAWCADAAVPDARLAGRAPAAGATGSATGSSRSRSRRRRPAAGPGAAAGRRSRGRSSDRSSCRPPGRRPA